MSIFSKIVLFGFKLIRRLWMLVLRNRFRSAGENFVFDPFGHYSFDTIEVGDDVFIGQGAYISSTKSTIIFGSKIMLGPRVTIIGGDHNTSVIGSYMYDVKEKKITDDLPVIVRDDVWIGTGATILKGVTVGTGSIIAAGALVINDVPDYSIIGGVPGKVLRYRFEGRELEEHIKLLNE